MKTGSVILWLSCSAIALTGCGSVTPDAVHTPADVQNVTEFNGTWDVLGRTGNEDGSNEPVCGSETGVGVFSVTGVNVAGTVVNKSGFDYSVEGTVDKDGKLNAMMLYSGYDAAKLEGKFTADHAKGTWSDALNFCPGVWEATKRQTQADPAKKPLTAEQKTPQSS